MRIITQNLEPDFAKHLVVFQTSADLKTFYEGGLAVEDAIHTGIFHKGESFSRPKRIYFSNSNTLFGPNTYNPVQASSSNPKPVKIEPVNQIATQSPPLQNTSLPGREFYQFPFPLTTFYKKLLEKNDIKPLDSPKELLVNHNPNV